MEISESMKRAGWRECPSQELWDGWRAFGYWQMVDVSERIITEHYDYTLLKRLNHLPKYCRPINKCGDFDIRGWGEQPAPVTVAESVCVWDIVDRAILDACIKNPQEKETLREFHALLYSRYQVGMSTYGQPLVTHDGRDSMKDFADEVGDAWMYAIKMNLEGRGQEVSDYMDRIIRAVSLIGSDSAIQHKKPAPVVPDKPGLWWRKNSAIPIKVTALNDELLYKSPNDEYVYPVRNDGQWLGPCVKPEASNV